MKKNIRFMVTALMAAVMLMGTVMSAGRVYAAETTEAQETTDQEMGQEAEAEAAPGMLMGGWSASADPAVTEEVTAVFEKATEGLLGVAYTPVACLGTQVVAGTNYCILCQAAPVVQDPAPYYVLMYIYANLEGGAEILNIADLDISAFAEY